VRITGRQKNKNYGSIKPVKSLGQSFLTHEPTADKLVEALELSSDDTVLEIGAGKGILTGRLLQKAKLVIAIEVDARLVKYLNEKFSSAGNLEVVHADFLKFELKCYRRLKVIGNLPYCISTAILWQLLDNYECWQTAVLTTQREFAQRVLANSGSSDYSALSVFAEFHCDRDRLFNIPARYFKPSPRVISTAFRLKIRKFPLTPANYAIFKTVVLAAFSPQPRKLLINNLAHTLNINRTDLKRIFTEFDFPPDIRATGVDLTQYIKLSGALAHFIK
jgi:16S rRNA (adenine1518-N6/adenine1519-N6)-dimethyltransferase